MAFTPFDIGRGTNQFPTIPFLDQGSLGPYCTAVNNYFEKYRDFLQVSPADLLLQGALEAGATLAILLYQKGKYDDVADDQRDLIDDAVTKFCNTINDLIDGQDYENAYPDVPEAAEYVPVDSCVEFEGAMQCIIDTVAQGEQAARLTDLSQLRNAIARMVQLDPKYVEQIAIYQCQVQELLEGKVSENDVMRLLGNVAESALALGEVGCFKRKRAKSIEGLRLRAQSIGRQKMQELWAMMDQHVFSIDRQIDLTQLVVTPIQRINLALIQAQLLQQSLQNVNNQAALKAPYLLAELQAKLNEALAILPFEASKANMISQYVPNYAGILQPQISSLSQFAVGVGRNIFASNVGELESNKGIFDRGTQGFPYLTQF